MKQIRCTREGYEKLKIEYEDLKLQRPDAVMHLKRSREMGDLSENGYYKASRAKLSSIDARLFQLALSIKQAVIIDDKSGNIVGIGRTVTLTDGKKEMIYHIVGDLEADPGQGKISLLSPLGKALEAKKIGDNIEFHSPRGIINYSITKIS